MRQASWFGRLSVFATVLAFCVVVLGAWVRLTDAGLGCPDWPGCYGQMIPTGGANLEAFPDRPHDAGKAWREMIHRYFAGLLGLVILLLAVIAWRNRGATQQPVKLPLFLLVLVIFQALLGMWTVTMLLKPVIVSAHLLGGMATLGLLVWLALKSMAGAEPSGIDGPVLKPAALLALFVLGAQIALGGWTSSNYAALACPDFPTCQSQWWPRADFAQGFVLWRAIGIDYTGGTLEHPARIAIHLTHRIGALATLLVVGTVGVLTALRAAKRRLRRTAWLLVAVLLAQATVGVLIVKLGLPVGLATAHNAMAALLLVVTVTLNYRIRNG